MSRITSAALACVLLVSGPAFAADGALAPGQPAGVQKAQLGADFTIIAVGGILLAAAVAVLVNGTQGHSGGASTTATSG